MDKKNLKKLLKDEMNANIELHDFCIECIEHIFKEDGEYVKEDFNQLYECIDEGYGISLKCFISNNELRKNRMKQE